jgi:hypothetical protein
MVCHGCFSLWEIEFPVVKLLPKISAVEEDSSSRAIHGFGAVPVADLQNRRILSRAAAVMLAIGNLTGSFLPSLVKRAVGSGNDSSVRLKRPNIAVAVF